MSELLCKDEDIKKGNYKKAQIYTCITNKIEEKFQSLNKEHLANKSHNDNIPLISHHLWLSIPGRSKEIFPANIENLKKKTTLMDADNSKQHTWKHILWTNDKEVTSKTKESLKDSSIEIRNIDDYKQDFITYDKIKLLLEQKVVGAAVDILKMEVLNVHGGIMMDLNYNLITSPLTAMTKCSAVHGIGENYMLATTPKDIATFSYVETVNSLLDEYIDFEKSIDSPLCPTRFTNHLFQDFFRPAINLYGVGSSNEDALCFGTFGYDSNVDAKSWQIFE